MRSKTIIGENIYQLRLSRKWSQRQLAEAAGLSLGTISAIELGNTPPYLATIEKLARVLEVPAADLQNGLLKPEWAFTEPAGIGRPRVHEPKVPRVRPANAIGEDYSRRRVALGLTQKQFGDQVGVSGGSIAEIEAGRRKPGPVTLFRLAAFLGVPMAELGGAVRPAETDTLGQRIRAARWAKGWSQKELGEKAGINTVSIFTYEKDKSVPAPARLARLALLLDVPLAVPLAVPLEAPPKSEKPRRHPVTGISVLLKELGWSRKELAQTLGVSRQELARFAGLPRSVSRENFEGWARAMEVSPDGRVMRTPVARWQPRQTTPGNEVGDLIYRLRTGRRISQRELAEQAKMSPGALSSMEVGRTKPGPATRKKLALVLGVEEDELGTKPGRRVKPAPQTLGQIICAARRGLGWSQMELGQKIGEKGRVISGYELDRTVPTRTQLARLGRLLKVALQAPPKPERAIVLSIPKAAAAIQEQDAASRKVEAAKRKEVLIKRRADAAKRREEKLAAKQEAAAAKRRREAAAAIRKAEAANRKAEAAIQEAKQANRKVEAAIREAPGWTLLGSGIGAWRHVTDWTLGRAIFAARQLRGWSQAVLGKKIGREGATISRFENNKVVPAAVELDQLERALKVRFVKPEQPMVGPDSEETTP